MCGGGGVVDVTLGGVISRPAVPSGHIYSDGKSLVCVYLSSLHNFVVDALHWSVFHFMFKLLCKCSNTERMKLQ